MTLALYGKSRRRQGALLTAALLAVIIATVGALSVLRATSATGGGGNNACPDKYPILIDKFEFKNGTYQWESGSGTPGQQVTITGGSSTGGNWSSTVPIGPVIIKASTDFKVIPNSPPYPPDTYSGTFDNTGMTNPGGQVPAISNVQFCTTPKGTLFVGKVKDPSSGVPAADGSQFSGTATNQGNSAVHNWGPITFGGFSTISNIPAGTYTLAETGTQNGWTPYGWTTGLVTQNGPTCPPDKASYTAGSSLADVQVNANETKVVCVMNTKTTGNIQVHKYLPKSNPNDNAPWQNQGNGQSQWTFTVYGSLSDAQNGTNPLASFNQLGSNSPALPQTDLWIKETGMPPGHQFFGWFVPDGDNNSGNDKCNQRKLDGSDLTSTDAILHIPASYWSTKGNKTGLFHICAYNKPKQPDAPQVSKVAKNPGYQSGYARWVIKISNGNGVPIGVQVNDSGVENDGSISGGTCSDSDISDGQMTCTVNANATLEIPVKKAVTQQCKAGEAGNTATIKWRPNDQASWSEPLTATGATITIPADETKCSLPQITKTLVQNGSSQTTDPDAIVWVVTVTNPNGTNGTSRTVYIKDQGVTVVGTPTATGSPWPGLCTIPINSSFEAELNSNTGVQCVMPAGSSITFTVKPKTTPQRACEDQVFTNTAHLFVGSTEAQPITAQGPAITLLGNPDLCTKEIKICKVLEDNGDGILKTGQQFTIDVKDGSQTQQVTLTVDEGSTTPACKTLTVPANATVTVGEADTRPANWNGDADGYPKVTQDGNTYTVTNKEKPKTIQVTFVKKICDTFKDVPRNSGSNVNHIGAPYYPGLTENDLGTTEGKCQQVQGWNFQLWTGTSSNNPWPGNSPTGTLLGTYTTGTHTLTPSVVAELTKSPQRLLVTEVYQPGYAFAALKCEGDNINQDNWEWLFWDQVKDDGKITCTAYNVPATKQITVQKTFYGVSQVSQADYPTFTISDGVDFNTACTGPALSGSGPVTATWTCTVPYLWNGTVTETPAEGWERCAAVSAQVAGNGSQTQEPFTFTNCKQPTIVVKKVVTNVVDDPTQFTVTLTGGQSSQTGQIAEAGPVNATFTGLSTLMLYDLTEQPQNGYQVLGWAYANGDGTCPEGPADYSANSKDKVTGMVLQPGVTRVVCFYNERFGSVVVDKQAPAGTVAPGTTFNWTISVSVANGPTSADLTLTDTLPSGFTYGSPSAASPLSCTLNGLVLSCTLPANTPIGTYTVTIPATVPTNTFEVCGEHTNTVTFEGAGITTEDSDSATVTIGCTASDGRILVKKVVRGQPGDTTSFTAELTGPGISGTATQPFSQQNVGFFLGLAAGTFSVSEQPKAGYDYAGWAIGTIVGESVQCPANPTGTGSASVTLTNLAPQAAVCFYNDARVTIRVHKTLNVIGFTSNGQGWQFTLTGCGITPQTKTTDVNGIAEFTNLPPALGCSYTVTETVQAGWTPQFVSQTAQPTQGGQVVTLEFLNIKVFEPPCTDPNDPRCQPPTSPTPTPTTTTTATPTPTGTATNTPTPTATPTNTPTPTPTNTPVTQVAGERTPGPGTSPTPLAPATGFGFGAGQGGMSLLLVLAGLISLSLGLGFIALGRRTNR